MNSSARVDDKVEVKVVLVCPIEKQEFGEQDLSIGDPLHDKHESGCVYDDCCQTGDV